MGLFLQAVVALHAGEGAVRAALAEMEKNGDMGLVASECQCRESRKGTAVLCNEACAGYGDLAKGLSEALEQPVLLLYIYDEDFWGYFFYEGGRELDCFQPIPDYFEEVPEEERGRMLGNSGLVSEYFGVEEAEIEGYLTEWTEEKLECYEEKAYADDEFGQCDCWQMADFMRRLGFPYEWE